MMKPGRHESGCSTTLARVPLTASYDNLSAQSRLYSICREIQMRPPILALVLLNLVFAVSAQAQDCACEAQALPETLAIVNSVKITASDINKSIGKSVSQLQQQVIEARKRELDLMINSKLLALEA